MQRVPYRKLATLLAGLSVWTMSGAALRAEPPEPKVVLELFTSQGCSSCPSADRLIAQYDDREDVLAVTLPVKLWDYLGWSDTLATEINTKRQMAYSVARGDRDVYTPQLVVNGEKAILGSDEAAIENAIQNAALALPIDLSLRGGVLTIRVGDAETALQNATIWLMVVEDEIHVPVNEGENCGRKLKYYNVVRDMRPVGIWKGDPLTLELPLTDMDKYATSGCVVIAQADTFKGPGQIVGAAQLDQIFPARTVGAINSSAAMRMGIQ